MKREVAVENTGNFRGVCPIKRATSVGCNRCGELVKGYVCAADGARFLHTAKETSGTVYNNRPHAK